MTMEKRGVISENTPSQCCGGGKCGSASEAPDAKQRILPFPGVGEPTTEKQADDMQESAVNKAIDAVKDETDGCSE